MSTLNVRVYHVSCIREDAIHNKQSILRAQPNVLLNSNNRLVSHSKIYIAYGRWEIYTKPAYLHVLQQFITIQATIANNGCLTKSDLKFTHGSHQELVAPSVVLSLCTTRPLEIRSGISTASHGPSCNIITTGKIKNCVGCCKSTPINSTTLTPNAMA